MQRGLPHDVPLLDVGSGRQQAAHHALPALDDGTQQRRDSLARSFGSTSFLSSIWMMTIR